MSVFKYDADGPYFDKDPRAELDYTYDWVDWLVTSAYVASSMWSADAGVTITSTLVSGSKATCWVSGGTDGMTYTIRNWVYIDGGLVDSRSFRLKVTDK